MNKGVFSTIGRAALVGYLAAFLAVAPGCTRVIESKASRGDLVEAHKEKIGQHTSYEFNNDGPMSLNIKEQNIDSYRLVSKFNKIDQQKIQVTWLNPYAVLIAMGAAAVTLGVGFFIVLAECYQGRPYTHCSYIDERTVITDDTLSVFGDVTQNTSYVIPASGTVRVKTTSKDKVTLLNDLLLPLDANGTAIFDKALLSDKVNLGDEVEMIWSYADQSVTTKIPADEIKQIVASRTPPHLTIAAKDIRPTGGLKKGFLKGEEQGEMQLTVANSDKRGTAWDVWLAVNSNNCPGVSFDTTIAVGDLKPGEHRNVAIPISAALEATACKLDMTVQAKEKFQQDSKKVKIPQIVIRAVDRPDLAVSAITHSGTPQNGRSVDVTATVTNNGVGEAKGVLVTLADLPSGVTPSWTIQKIGDMPPHSKQTIPLNLRFDKLFGSNEGKHINLAMTVSDSRPIARSATKKYSMEYSFARPQIKVADIQYFDGNDPYGLSEGNGDGRIEQDERILVRVKVINTGTMGAENVQVSLASDRLGNRLVISPNEPQSISSLRPNEEKTVEFKFRVPNSLEPGQVNFTVSASEWTFATKVADVSRKTIYEAGTLEGELAMATLATRPKSPRAPVAASENIDEVPATGFKRDAYALVVGISKYKLRGIKPVQYAKNDAQAMRDYLENVGGIPRNNIRCLTDEQADLSGIRKELGWIRRNAGENSQVVIYYSGHGVPDSRQQPYLLPWGGEPQAIEDTGISLADLKKSVNEFKTKRVLIALDACYTGDNRSEVAEGQRAGVAWADDDTTPTEAVLINSSGVKEASWDYDEKQHGLFTYYLLKGMRGAAPDKNGDGMVCADELYAYLKREIPPVARQLRNAPQNPVIQGSGKGVVVSKRVE